MIVTLEYIICQLQEGKVSVAIKSHRNRRQNPGLRVEMRSSDVLFELIGLSPGSVEAADPHNPAATRLDFYVGRTALLSQRNSLPHPRATSPGIGLPLTNPTGRIRRGGKLIHWRGTLCKLPLTGAAMFFPSTQRLARTSEPCYLNVDWEPAMYPLPDNTRLQLHFGVESDFVLSTNRRRTVPLANLIMSDAEYANVYDVLMHIY